MTIDRVMFEVWRQMSGTKVFFPLGVVVKAEGFLLCGRYDLHGEEPDLEAHLTVNEREGDAIVPPVEVILIHRKGVHEFWFAAEALRLH